MKKIQMVTKTPHRYGGKKHILGDPFEISHHDQRLVEALGWGVPVGPKPAPAKKRVVETREKRAEPVQKPAVTHEPTPVVKATEPEPSHADLGLQEVEKPKRTYKRRDMTADD